MKEWTPDEIRKQGYAWGFGDVLYAQLDPILRDQRAGQSDDESEALTDAELAAYDFVRPQIIKTFSVLLMNMDDLVVEEQSNIDELHLAAFRIAFEMGWAAAKRQNAPLEHPSEQG